MRLRHAVAAVLLLLCAIPASAALPPLQDLFAVQKAFRAGLIPAVGVECATNGGLTYNATTNLWSCSNPTSSAGTASGTGNVATETGTIVHKTVLTLTAVSVTTADHTTSGGSGSLLIYTFPEGVVKIEGCVANLTTSEASANITNTAALVHSLGSAAEGGDASLTSTEADIIASTAGTLSSSAGTFAGYNATSVAFDGHATAATIYLNVAMPDAASSGAGAVAYTGTITCVWHHLGDF